MIILLILITSSHDNVWISLGENYRWSLLGLKGLKGYKLAVNKANRNKKLSLLILKKGYHLIQCSIVIGYQF